MFNAIQLHVKHFLLKYLNSPYLPVYAFPSQKQSSPPLPIPHFFFFGGGGRRRVVFIPRPPPFLFSSPLGVNRSLLRLGEGKQEEENKNKLKF